MEIVRLRAQLRAQIILLFTRYNEHPEDKSTLIGAEALLKFGESSGLLTGMEIHGLHACLVRLTPKESLIREKSGVLTNLVSKMLAEGRQFKQELNELVEAHGEAVELAKTNKQFKEVSGLILDRAFCLVNRARSEGLISEDERIDLMRGLHERSMPTP